MTALICPLCSQACFDNLESLRMRLITAATQKINCPMCDEALMGLDKFTIHLFGHSLPQNSAPEIITSVLHGQEVTEEPPCTVNMEDLSFLTTWEVSGRPTNNHEGGNLRPNVFNQNLSQDPSSSSHSEGLVSCCKNNSYTSEVGHPTYSERQSQMTCGTAEHHEERQHLQELCVEIQPKHNEKIKIFQPNIHQIISGPDIMSPDILSPDIMSPDMIRESAFRSIPQTPDAEESHSQDSNTVSKGTIQIWEISEPTHMDTTQVVAPEMNLKIREEDFGMCRPIEMSPDFLSTLSEFRQQPSNNLSQSSSPEYMQELQNVGHRNTDAVQEEATCTVTMPDSPEAITPRGMTSSSVETQELSEYMSELFQQKLPVKNFTVPPTQAKRTVKCELCGVEMDSEKLLTAHMELVHAKPDPYPCKLCGRGFRMRGSLLVHTRVAHGPTLGEQHGDGASDTRQFHCSQCTKSFKKEQHLTQHMKTHDGKQWQCETCSKFFTTKYFLKKHQRLHTGEMPYCCETCKKTFTFQQSYHKHLLYHSADKPHECADCGRSFKELSTLHNHQRIHSGEKPFACETCGKCFRQRVSYIVHQRIHTGVLPYQCTACKKKFRYKVSQRSHKCTAQPPGVVVRQPGDLIQRILEQRHNILQCIE